MSEMCYTTEMSIVMNRIYQLLHVMLQVKNNDVSVKFLWITSHHFIAASYNKLLHSYYNTPVSH